MTKDRTDIRERIREVEDEILAKRLTAAGLEEKLGSLAVSRAEIKEAEAKLEREMAQVQADIGGTTAQVMVLTGELRRLEAADSGDQSWIDWFEGGQPEKEKAMGETWFLLVYHDGSTAVREVNDLAGDVGVWEQAADGRVQVFTYDEKRRKFMIYSPCIEEGAVWFGGTPGSFVDVEVRS